MVYCNTNIQIFPEMTQKEKPQHLRHHARSTMAENSMQDQLFIPISIALKLLGIRAAFLGGTTFSMPFKSTEEMSQQTPLQLNGTRLRSKASLKKQFRWFYTNYVFSETFYCVGDTFQLADTLYADKALISYWFTGEPNLVKGLSGAEASQKLSEIEPAINRWLNDNLIKVGFDYIVSHYDSIPAPPVSKERFIELHDSLVQFIMAGSDDLLDIKPEERLQAFFHSDAYNSFFNDETTLGKGLTDELEALKNPTEENLKEYLGDELENDANFKELAEYGLDPYEMMGHLFKHFDYKIGDITVNGDTATAKVTVTNVKLDEIMANLETSYMNSKSQEEIAEIYSNGGREALYKDLFKKLYEDLDKSTDTKDTELTLSLTKKDNEWSVDDSSEDELVSAAFGGANLSNL